MAEALNEAPTFRVDFSAVPTEPSFPARVGQAEQPDDLGQGSPKVVSRKGVCVNLWELTILRMTKAQDHAVDGRNSAPPFRNPGF